jgi:hypothetical protein
VLTELVRQDPRSIAAPAKASPNRSHGEKNDFVKVTLPLEVYELIMGEVTRRKMAKGLNPQISAVIREAVGSTRGGLIALVALILSPGMAAAPDLTLVCEGKWNDGTDRKFWGWTPST